jgi:hypothetical protein
MTGLGQVERPKVKKEPVFNFITFAVVRNAYGHVYAARILSNKPVVDPFKKIPKPNTAGMSKRRREIAVKRYRRAVEKRRESLPIGQVLKSERGVKVDYILLRGTGWMDAQSLMPNELKKKFASAKATQAEIYKRSGPRLYNYLYRQIRSGKIIRSKPPVRPECSLIGESKKIIVRRTVPRKRKRI